MAGLLDGITRWFGERLSRCLIRPAGLHADEVDAIIRHAMARLGRRVDLKNAIDPARYRLPTPPVPVRRRRRMLSLDSGDPTCAVCSTLIAQAFSSVRHPILPLIDNVPSKDPRCPGCMGALFRVRHHRLFGPRDFDVSPWVAVVKPTLEAGFDDRALSRHDHTRELGP